MIEQAQSENADIPSPGSWLRFLVALTVTGMLAGCLGAVFLVSLDQVTLLHHAYPMLLLGLPIAGVVVATIYQRWGGLAGQGSHLLVEEIHDLQGKVPLRMAPLVLLATLVTHLFGGSAGREGTAVQMGGSIAAYGAKRFGLSLQQQRLLLLGGIAAGFGAVFGTPWAGAIFAVELPVRGRWHYRMLLPALFASWLGHLTCLAWGVHHTDYRSCGLTTDGFAHLSILLVMAVIAASICFGLAGRLFVLLSEACSHWFAKVFPNPQWRAFCGGILVIVLVMLLGSADYLGLGVVANRPGGISILSSFHEGGAEQWSWFWKIAFTVITLSSGFKGGEVTPLFFIGAALGNVLGISMGMPVALFAGLGLIAVFAGAAKTPLACTILGIEIFGPHYTALFALACLVSYLVSGRKGIYQNQK